MRRRRRIEINMKVRNIIEKDEVEESDSTHYGWA